MMYVNMYVVYQYKYRAFRSENKIQFLRYSQVRFKMAKENKKIKIPKKEMDSFEAIRQVFALKGKVDRMWVLGDVKPLPILQILFFI